METIGPGGESQFSPDGQWVAYTNREIIAQRLSGSGARIQISSGRGAQPRWSRDGRTIFYIAPDRKLMAVSFDPLRESAGAPRALFQTRIVAPFHVLFQYDVAPDGRFLVNAFPQENTSPLTLLTNWRPQLQR